MMSFAMDMNAPDDANEGDKIVEEVKKEPERPGISADAACAPLRAKMMSQDAINSGKPDLMIRVEFDSMDDYEDDSEEEKTSQDPNSPG